MKGTFNDRLKARRKEKGISQQQLADAIYVSRSAVAKWENGLGLPSKSSYDSLLEYFGITAEEFPLNEEIEIEAVEHNRRLHVIKSMVFWVTVLALAILPIWLVSAVMNGFGFTSQMAAGELWVDNECLHVDGYDVYYNAYKSDDEALSMINSFCIVENLAFGYNRCDTDDFKRGVYTDDGEKYGNLYTLKSDTGYHHIFCSDIYMNESGTYLYIVLYNVRIKDEVIIPYRSSYFVTECDIYDFYSGDKHFIVK